MAVQLFCGWLEFIWSFILLFQAQQGHKNRSGPPGLVQSGGLLCWPMESQCLCSPCVGIYETRIPQSPGVICVIITIITLRLQEIITVASEEKPCLCAVSATSHAYREHQSSVGVEASCANTKNIPSFLKKKKKEKPLLFFWMYSHFSHHSCHQPKHQHHLWADSEDPTDFPTPLQSVHKIGFSHQEEKMLPEVKNFSN